MGLTLSMLLLVLVALSILGATWWALSRYEKRWEARWQGHHVAVVNRATREELWIDGELVHDHRSYGVAFSANLEGELDHPDRGRLPVRARIHMDNGVSTACDLTIDGEVVPLVDVGLIPAEAPKADAAPQDARWEAASKLLARVRSESGTGEARFVRVANDLQSALRRTLLALEHVEEARAAHAVLGGGAGDLDAVEARWEARANELVVAIRALHLEVVARESPESPSAADAAEALLGRLEADAEVDAATLAGAAIHVQERLPKEGHPASEADGRRERERRQT